MIIKLLSDKRPIVKASINNIEAQLLVDTGSSINILDSSQKNKFHFKEGKELGEIVGIGSNTNGINLVKNVNVFISDTFEIFQWACTDISSVKESILKQSGIEIDGILGTPGIKQLEISIDLNNNILKLGY